MKRSRFPLFLMELVVMLAVFALAAAVCTGVLMKAVTLSDQGENLNRAVEMAASAAECWKAQGDGTALGMTQGKTGWVLWLDSDWKTTSPEQQSFQVCLTEEGSRADITVTQADSGAILYAITAERRSDG